MFSALLPTSDRRTAPLSHFARLATQIDAATPVHRDRLIDAIRVVAMLVVAFGHWLVADISVAADGTVAAQDVLAAVPWTQALTLLLQVMGLFFAVSGFSSAASLAKGQPDGWVASRVARLLAPTGVYVAVWGALMLVLPAVLGTDVAVLAGRAVAIHLWFVAVVSVLFLLTPPLLRVWRAVGWSLPAALVVTSLTIDVLHRVLDVPLVGWLNFPVVWSVAVVLGFAWFDGGLADRSTQVALVVGGVAVTAALVATPWIGLSMVGVGDAAAGNNFPPSTALVGLTMTHVGLVLLAAPRLRRALARPSVWAVVALGGQVGVTVYLWHLTAMVLGVGVTILLGGNAWMGAAGSGVWWLSRIVWVGGLVALLVPLVAGLRRTEAMRTRVGSGRVAPGTRTSVVAVGLAAWGTARIALLGFSGQQVEVLAVLAACVLLGAVPARRVHRGRAHQARAS